MDTESLEIFKLLGPIFFSHVSQVLVEFGKKWKVVDAFASQINFLFVVITVILYFQLFGGSLLEYFVIALAGGAISSGSHTVMRNIKRDRVN